MSGDQPEVLRVAAAVLGDVGQVGIVVDDAEELLAAASATFPITRWRAYRYGPHNVRDLTYRGAPSEMAFWVYLSDATPQIEYVVSEAGPNVYTEWLETSAPGPHHVAVYTDELERDVARMTARGFEVVQSGWGYGLDGDGGFAYLDTRAALGLFVELIAVPARRRAPDREWVVEREPG